MPVVDNRPLFDQWNDKLIQTNASGGGLEAKASGIMMPLKRLVHWQPHITRDVLPSDVMAKVEMFRQSGWCSSYSLSCRQLSTANRKHLKTILSHAASTRSDEEQMLWHASQYDEPSRVVVLKDDQGALFGLVDGNTRVAALLYLAFSKDSKDAKWTLDFEVPIAPVHEDVSVSMCVTVSYLTNTSHKSGREPSFLDTLYHLSNIYYSATTVRKTRLSPAQFWEELKSARSRSEYEEANVRREYYNGLVIWARMGFGACWSYKVIQQSRSWSSTPRSPSTRALA